MGNIAQMLSENQSAQSVHNQSYVAALRQKWGQMLEGVGGGDHHLNSMAVLYENQANYLKGLNEDTRSTNVGEFLKFVFPVLRRVWPRCMLGSVSW